MSIETLITDWNNGITVIDTEYIRPHLDASHLVIDNQEAAFVDTGTSLALQNLLDTLKHYQLQKSQVKYIFLTHVHLDHAGGAGALAQCLPDAKVVIHPRGAKHMIEPQRLIDSSKLVYGEEIFKTVYGSIEPVLADAVIEANDGDVFSLGSRQLEIMHSPGHAMHHYCLIDREHKQAFTGDTFGVSYKETTTSNGAFIMPSTSPTQFDPDALHDSIDKIIATQVNEAYLTHYSKVENLDILSQHLHRHIDQYVMVAEKYADDDNRAELITGALTDFTLAALSKHGASGDKAHWHEFIGGDLALNAQGLISWLVRTRS